METIFYFQSSLNTYTPDKLSGVKHAAGILNWHVREINGIPSKKGIEALVDFWSPIGFIVDGGRGLSDVSQSTFDALPTVFLDVNPHTLDKNSPCVSHDSFATGRMAAKELLLTGYPNYAFMPNNSPRRWSEDREAGFREALKINHFTCSTFRKEAADVNDVTYQKDLHVWLDKLPKPCGLFAANDMMAVEVLTAAAHLGIAVPRDLAVVGVDNFPQICDHTIPPLTSILPDFLRGGELAVKMLKSIIDGKGHTSLRMTFGPRHVAQRASSRTFHTYDREVMNALSLIQRKACEGLTAHETLSVFSCSRRMAEKKFKAIVGHSILDEIHKVRIAEAKSILTGPKTDLASISDFCGFKNPNSLRKLFRKKTGHTLSGWRKAHRQP